MLFYNTLHNNLAIIYNFKVSRTDMKLYKENFVWHSYAVCDLLLVVISGRMGMINQSTTWKMEKRKCFINFKCSIASLYGLSVVYTLSDISIKE